jgi:hypothetical protein
MEKDGEKDGEKEREREIKRWSLCGVTEQCVGT